MMFSLRRVGLVAMPVPADLEVPHEGYNVWYTTLSKRLLLYPRIISHTYRTRRQHQLRLGS